MSIKSGRSTVCCHNLSEHTADGTKKTRSREKGNKPKANRKLLNKKRNIPTIFNRRATNPLI